VVAEGRVQGLPIEAGVLGVGRWRVAAQVWALLLLSLGLNLIGNDRTGLWDRDEPRYVGAVREMRSRGDWITPYFNGVPRYHKPILIYWLMGLTTALCGDNPFAARLVSAFAGAGVVVLTWLMARRMMGGRAGLWAGVFTATAPAVVLQAKIATTDALVALEILAALACLWELARRPSPVLAMTFWSVIGLSLLTKGPVGPALVAAAVVCGRLLGWRPDLRNRLHTKRGLVICACIVIPWLAAVSLVSYGEFLRFSLGQELLGHMASVMEKHGGFPGYYLIGSLLAFLPWGAFGPAAMSYAWTRRKLRPDLAFLLGWVLGPLALLELMGTKLVHYYFPAYPAWAMLAGFYVSELELRRVNLGATRLGRVAAGLWLGAALAVGCVLVVGLVYVPAGARLAMVLLAGTIAVGTVLAIWMVQRGRLGRGLQVLAATWAVGLFILGGFMIPGLEPLRLSRAVGEHLRRLVDQTGLAPVLVDYQASGVVYAYGAPIPQAHDRTAFFKQLEGRDAVLSVLNPSEIPRLARKYELEITPLERVVGPPAGLFSRETLDLVRIERAAGSKQGVNDLARGASSARR